MSRDPTGRDPAARAAGAPSGGGAAAAAAEPLRKRPLVRAPEPAFFWLRYAPRRWPPPPVPWTDLARGGLGARPGDRRAGSPGDPLPDLDGAPLDDVVWLPPVPAEKAAERDRLALGHLQAGTPVLLQLLSWETPSPEVLAAGAVPLYDLLPALLGIHPGRAAEPVAVDRRPPGGAEARGGGDASGGDPGRRGMPSRGSGVDELETGGSGPTGSATREPAPAAAAEGGDGAGDVAGDEARGGAGDGAGPGLDDGAGDGDGGAAGVAPGAGDVESRTGLLRNLPAGAAAVWPLVPGCTDDPALWEAGCAALAEAGVAVVQSTVPRLAPADRRRLAEEAGGDDFERLFHSLFHGDEPDEGAFARVAAAAGLDVFLPRPLPRPPATGQGSRRIAAAVFLVADLWLRLGRPPSQGQDFFRAARWIDDSGYDPEALAREGNLGVVEVIDDAERELIEDAVARDGHPALLAELLAEYTGAG